MRGQRDVGQAMHRGPAGRKIKEGQGATLGMVWNQAQLPAWMEGQGTSVSDHAPSGRLLPAAMVDGTLVLERIRWASRPCITVITPEAIYALPLR